MLLASLDENQTHYLSKYLLAILDHHRSKKVYDISDFILE